MDQESIQIRKTMATKVPIEEDIMEIEGEEEKRHGTRRMQIVTIVERRGAIT